MLSICLFEPEIPQNTGNIARTAAVTGTPLHLVRPLGFDISEKAVRHAGLDYWGDVDLTVHDDIDSFLASHGADTLYFFSAKGRRLYSDISYKAEGSTFFIFGRESRGIDEEILRRYPENTLRIPIRGNARSLNLSNSVAIAVYEYYRQLGFLGLSEEDGLHRMSWQ